MIRMHFRFASGICWYTCQTQIIWFSSLFGDKLYVQFHDECWRVPVYDDNQLFELPSLCGMFMDYNWTEILKWKNLFRCNLMNFSKNTKCLECEELRPKRRLTCSE
ncbi:uncharacterized protein [Rutidosis leptorrhynchoides]|uniref:uncharacterized protein isoform X2 n=1 Tax=Rutidosis leptorrhynchoides TaxID=125765 RepID=UPI003A98DBF0